MAKTKILISVKTYPNLSVKYDELVCTAGVKEDGSWVRIYPVQFRNLDYAKQYKKYQWIEIDLVKNTSDMRPESFKPYSYDTIKILGKIGTENNWHERKKFVLKNVSENLNELIEKAHNNLLSLAVFKPKEILKFIAEKTEGEWNERKLNVILSNRRQLSFFEPENKNDLPKKLPYKFSYSFKDINGKKSTLMIEDWEIGELYWNCLKKYGDEQMAVEKVKEKYFDNFAKKTDLHFFLGTTLKNHREKSRNPFVIIGVFYPPKSEPSLFGGDL